MRRNKQIVSLILSACLAFTYVVPVAAVSEKADDIASESYVQDEMMNDDSKSEADITGEETEQEQIDITNDENSDKGDFSESVGENDVEKLPEEASEVKEAVSEVPVLTYSAHVSNIGWQDYIETGMAGTTGKNLPMEALKIDVKNNDKVGMKYSAHVSNIGWQDYVIGNETAGTTGKNLPMEAIKIELTGEDSGLYDVYYRVHVTNAGWLDWAKNGQAAGSQGYAYSMQAIEILLLQKDSEQVPSNTTNPFLEKVNVYQQAHVQNIGWQAKSEISTTIAGTTGKNLNLEAIKLSSDHKNLGIEYRTHVCNIGWQDYVSNGTLAGTTGKNLSIEAIQVRLTGENADQYDIYYRAHVANLGWLDWAKNDEVAGSIGIAFPMQALQVVMVNKGEAAPGATGIHCVNNATVEYRTHLCKGDWGTYSKNGSQSGATNEKQALDGLEVKVADVSELGVKYSTHVSNIGWKDFTENGATAGSIDGANSIEAVKIALTGRASQFFDIWYRVYTDKFGWMGWTSNGNQAGTQGFACGIKSIQIIVQPKSNAAPGNTNNAFQKYVESEALRCANANLEQIGKDLRAAFNWSASQIKYQKIAEPSAGISHAEWYGIYGFKNKKGNCYVMAATFYWMAKSLGYDAYLVEGKVPLRGGKMGPHGWCEIVINGTTYVFDPDFTYETGRNGYQITYGASGTWRYSNYHRVN